MKYRWLAALVFCVRLSSLGQTVDPTRINGPALELIHEATAAARTHFYVYEGSDSGLNHGFPSGLFAHPLSALSKIHLDTACVADPSSPSGCTTDPDRLDRVRGTVMRVSFDPLSPGEFAGVNIEEPENWGVHQTGGGYDLRGATRVCFDAMSPTPASKVQFAVGGRTTSFLAIPSTWTPLCFDLGALGASSAILSEVHLLFAIATNDTNAPGGVTVLLDNVRFEPVPGQQQLAVSFPIANGVFGVLPAADVLPGRVAIPPDQILPNLTTIYESSLAVIALLGRGSAQDLESARVILDAFVYAADHDNQGLSLPESGEWRGLHSAYSSGDLALFNDQGPGAGKKGQIRFAGFSIASGLCGPSHFCLVLDGSTGGNVAFAMFALEAGYQRFRDPRYLETARVLGNWIHSALLDTSGTGFGGYFLGYPDEGAAKSLLTGKSIENVADIFRAFSTLSDICTRLGLAAEAQEWNRRAKIAGDFVMAMFDDVDGRFYAGTVPPTVSPSPGIQPDGPVQGADVVNTFDFLDAQTFTTLPLASSPLYRNAIDWRRPIQWMLDHQATTVTVNGQQFHGFSLTASPTAGPNGIAWEFTGQAVVAMRFVDALYGEQRFAAQAQFYLDEIHKAQQLAPFGDGKGLPAATMEQGDLLPPREQCLSTPFQCIAQRVGLAATTWAIFADLDLNPFTYSGGNGDTVHELGVFTNGLWFLDRNGDFQFDSASEISGWGSAGDLPLMGDWNGDGFTDLGVFSGGTWFIDANGDGLFNPSTEVKGWGIGGWIPITGDWNGDGATDLGVINPSSMTWFRDLNGDFVFDPASEITGWGSPGNIAVVGDWDGDGDDDIGAFAGGVWFLDLNGDGAFDPSVEIKGWGVAGWTPVVGDWNGDGKDDIGAIEPVGSVWFRDMDGDYQFSPGTEILGWGTPGSTPVVVDWDGDGDSDVGVFTSGTWFLDLNGDQMFDAASEIKGWGQAGWTPVAAQWR